MTATRHRGEVSLVFSGHVSCAIESNIHHFKPWDLQPLNMWHDSTTSSINLAPPSLPPLRCPWARLLTLTLSENLLWITNDYTGSTGITQRRSRITWFSYVCWIFAGHLVLCVRSKHNGRWDKFLNLYPVWWRTRSWRRIHIRRIRYIYIKIQIISILKMNNYSWWTHRPAETPEDEAEAAVGIQTDGHFSGRVQLTLQLHRPAEGPNCIMGHLEGGLEGQKDTTRHIQTDEQTTGCRGGRLILKFKLKRSKFCFLTVYVFHFYSLLLGFLYTNTTKPGCAQSFAPYLSKYIFLYRLLGVYLRHWYLKRSSGVCLRASRL